MYFHVQKRMDRGISKCFCQISRIDLSATKHWNPNLVIQSDDISVGTYTVQSVIFDTHVGKCWDAV